VNCELHLYGHGPHGQGLFDLANADARLIANSHMEDWFEQAIKWLGELTNAAAKR